MHNSLIISTLFLLAVIPSLAPQKPLNADQVLAVAKSQAAKENKRIFLIFGASWCEDCHRLDAFLATPEIHTIFDKHFVITRITVAEENGGNPALNNPGGLDLLIKFGGVGPGGASGVPYICILNYKGKPIVSSRVSLNGENTPFKLLGFPSDPGEIDQFMAMLSKGSPSLTTKDAQVVKDWLNRIANN